MFGFNRTRRGYPMRSISFVATRTISVARNVVHIPRRLSVSSTPTQRTMATPARYVPVKNPTLCDPRSKTVAAVSAAPFHELDRRTIGIGDVHTRGPTPPAGLIEHNRIGAGRESRSTKPTQREFQVVDAQTKVPIFRTPSVRASRLLWPYEAEEFEDLAGAQIEVRVLKVHRFQPENRGCAPVLFFTPPQDRNLEEAMIEGERTIDVGNGQRNVVEPEGGHWLTPLGAMRPSRTGMVSLRNTSSIVSGRLTISASAPWTKRTPGRGSALKLFAHASWYAPVSRNASTSPTSRSGRAA